MKRANVSIFNLLVAVCFVFILSPLMADAHRSGCHRWHSCVSDSGSYTCGDLGHCSQCPDNQYCEGRKPRRASIEPQKKTPPIKRTEKDYQFSWCANAGGLSEYKLKDNSRVDCLTNEYAVEVDFAKKWAEAVGQSLHYAEMTGKKPAIVLIAGKSDSRHLDRLMKVAKKYQIKVWVVEK
tara:strand:- start:388 stop:927 length:540 start_codon:yes stop_codon:yes gene_type:complete